MGLLSVNLFLDQCILTEEGLAFKGSALLSVCCVSFLMLPLGVAKPNLTNPIRAGFIIYLCVN